MVGGGCGRCPEQPDDLGNLDMIYAVLEVDYEEKNTFPCGTLYGLLLKGTLYVYPYGIEGRYIVIMNEKEYNQFTNRAY